MYSTYVVLNNGLVDLFSELREEPSCFDEKRNNGKSLGFIHSRFFIALCVKFSGKKHYSTSGLIEI